MPLEPLDLQHAVQIQAGTEGRKRGHKFEFDLTASINNINCPYQITDLKGHLFQGNASVQLLNRALAFLGWKSCDSVIAIELGSLATAEGGKNWLSVNGVKVKACKSDVLLTLEKSSIKRTIGISVKQCNTKSPTNAQLYFTTAQAFCNLLARNQMSVSNNAITALKQFCGESGYRPLDNASLFSGRKTDPRRFFWEEINKEGRKELENLFTNKQDEITKLLLQKAYLDDPFLPELLIHKTKKIEIGDQEYSIYTIDELIQLSRRYGGFNKNDYSVRKGTYKDPIGITHEAPRFGIVQMQRGGQAQHPTQLQFNLQAGYFYKI